MSFSEWYQKRGCFQNQLMQLDGFEYVVDIYSSNLVYFIMLNLYKHFN